MAFQLHCSDHAQGIERNLRAVDFADVLASQFTYICTSLVKTSYFRKYSHDGAGSMLPIVGQNI